MMMFFDCVVGDDFSFGIESDKEKHWLGTSDVAYHLLVVRQLVSIVTLMMSMMR